MTVIGSGISAQVGMKAEGSYGTAATVDRFFEFLSEAIKNDVLLIDSPMIGGGRFLRSDRTKTVKRGAAGPLKFSVLNKGFNLLFQHMLGQDTVVPGPTVSGTADAAVSTTDTTLTDTRLTAGAALVVNAWIGATVTCNAKTMVVTSNTANTFTGTAWSAGGNPGNAHIWSATNVTQQHTCIPDPLALQGKSLTVQVGRPTIGGVVEPYTYQGGKVLDWELSCDLDKELELTLSMDFQTWLTATGLAAASYTATEEMWIFSEGALTIGGTTMSVKKFSIKGVNGLAADRRFLGNVKKEPLAHALAAITGTLEMEFEDLTRDAAWVAGTTAQLVLTFTSPTLIPTTAIPYSLTVTIPKIQYTGDTPNVGGPDIVQQGAPFRALFDGTNPVISTVMVCADTAP